MKRLISVVMLFCCAATAGEAKPFPSVPKSILQSTHRLASSSKNKNETTTSYGASVAVDLSKYGFKGNRFLLTASHCVLDGGKRSKTVLIETVRDGKKIWIHADVVVYDEDNDVALIRADEDMPSTSAMEDDDSTDIGDAVFAVGSPEGTATTATLGFLADKGSDIDARSRWFQSSNAVTHGNSGGPCFNANTEKIMGLVTAVVGEPGRQAPNITKLVGAPAINDFLKSNQKKIEDFLK